MNYWKIIERLAYVALIGLCIFGFMALRLVKTEAYLCANNPLNYSVTYVKNNLGTELYCSCSLADQHYAPFTLSSAGIQRINNDIVVTDPWNREFNISKLALSPAS